MKPTAPLLESPVSMPWLLMASARASLVAGDRLAATGWCGSKAVVARANKDQHSSNRAIFINPLLARIAVEARSLRLMDAKIQPKVAFHFTAAAKKQVFGATGRNYLRRKAARRLSLVCGGPKSAAAPSSQSAKMRTAGNCALAAVVTK